MTRDYTRGIERTHPDFRASSKALSASLRVVKRLHIFPFTPEVLRLHSRKDL
jgi:hypothetical protein